MKELARYIFSALREGDLALYRGSGNGLAPILLVAVEETSLGCVARLKHEYALKAELDAKWAARPVALTKYNDRMTLVLEDPGGALVDRLRRKRAAATRLRFDELPTLSRKEGGGSKKKELQHFPAPLQICYNRS